MTGSGWCWRGFSGGQYDGIREFEGGQSEAREYVVMVRNHKGRARPARQADASGIAPVTPKMLEAGACVLNARRDDPPYELVSAIYRAMAKVAPPRAKQSVASMTMMEALRLLGHK